MSKAMTLTHSLAFLQRARERVAAGWPSVEVALASTPGATVAARVEAARTATAESPPWVLALADALRRVDVARGMWGREPASMPPAVADLAQCAYDLRITLAVAQRCEDRRCAWEDAGGLSRAQAVCVLHLAVVLAQWDAAQQRAELMAQQAQAELERQRQRRAQVAAKAIWGNNPLPRGEEPPKEPRSLRDLARVSAAFDQWNEDES